MAFLYSGSHGAVTQDESALIGCWVIKMRVHVCGPENRTQSCARAEALFAESEPTVGARTDDLMRREGSAAIIHQIWPRRDPRQKGEEEGSGRLQLRERRARRPTPVPTKKLLYVCILSGTEHRNCPSPANPKITDNVRGPIDRGGL